MPFSSDFSRKNYCPNAHVLLKRRTLSKKHIALMFVERTSIFSKTLYSHAIFHFYMKNPLLSCLYLIKKPSILSKLLILWIKKVNRMLFFFFLIVHGKTTLSCPHFVKKTSTLLKTQCSHVLFFNLS